MAELPIIVLAFANEQEGRRYLRDLPEELRRLQDILKEAERDGLCRLEVLSNATLDQIFDVFTRNRDQVTILHYAGHADSGRLLLESNTAAGAAAHAAGLATFLGQRRGLQLVFLNGCSTRGQVARLLEAGVAAVIATARAIDDTMARSFAIAFYTELASGAPLRAAYESARGRVLAAHDSAPEAYYGGHRDLGSTSDDVSPDPTDDHGFPWEFRPGAELVERWSLPDAAGNPEFGLPHLPEQDLPERPFRHLSWFTEKEAEVFFGRGYQVRELYEQVTDPSSPPILLLHGSSGVGKSSLMDAGLVPRLGAGGHAVRYSRRNQRKGLTGSLRSALCLADEQTRLVEGWRAVETQLGKPVVVFLDQVEEVFTRPDAANPRELDEFLAVLAHELGNRDGRPRGKLVLGFRKEWFAEIDRRMAELNLPRSKVFLKPLDRRGIIEAIQGPTRQGRLQRQYRLTIEAGLPEIIADNLLADAGSALSSTLQVLLTKMWERARAANPTDPRFDRALYESLKAEGYLLKDVLDEGLKAIGRWNPAVEQSGLSLDVLVYHTTELGTASQRTRAELDERYSHQPAELDGLLNSFKDNYLLIEAEPRPDSPTRSTRLAHDLLAPLVQQRFRLSAAPGQRARRLLENRAPDWRDGKTGSVLDDTDLATVETGASGMRARTADEDRLVEASRLGVEQEKAREAERARRLREAEERQRQAELEKQKATEQRLKDQQEHNLRLRKRAVALGATLVLAVAAACLAAYTGWAAVRERSIAVGETKKANIAKTQADEAAEEAIKQERKAKVSEAEAREQEALAKKNLRIATAQNLAAWSLAASSHEALSTKPQQALLLAVEAVRATRDFHEPVTAAAEQALQDALSSTHGRALMGYTGEITAVAKTPDGRLITGSSDGTVWVWDLDRRDCRPLALKCDNDPVTALAVAADGQIVTGGLSGTIRVWNPKRASAPTRVLSGHDNRINVLTFAPDGRLVTGSADGTVGVWNLKKPDAKPIVFNAKAGPVQSLAVVPDGRLAIGGIGHPLVVWDPKRPESPPLVLKAPSDLNGQHGHVSLAVAPEGRIAAGYERNGQVHVWNLEKPTAAPLILHGRVTNGLSVLAIGPDGRLVIGGFNGTIVVYDLKDTDHSPLVLTGHQRTVTSATFAPDGRLVTGGVDCTVRVWDLKESSGSAEPLVLRGHDGQVQASTFVDGKLVTRSVDGTRRNAFGGTARVWDLKRPSNQPLYLHGDGDFVPAQGFAPDGRFVSVGAKREPEVWNLKDLSAEPLRLRGQGFPRMTTIGFRSDGLLATGAINGTVRVWDLKAPSAEPKLLKGHTEQVTSLGFAPDGRFFTGGEDHTLRVWDLKGDSDKSIVLSEKVGTILVMRFAPDGRLVTGSDGGMVRVWDLKDRSPQPLMLQGHRGAVISVAFAPDGRLVSASGDGTARVWDLKHPRAAPAVLSGHDGAVRLLAFAPDGRLVTGGHDGTVRLWDLNNTSVPPTVLGGQGPMISALAFAPDGRLISGSEDGTTRVWDLKNPSGQPLVLHGTPSLVATLGFAPDGRLVIGSDDGTVRVWDIDLDHGIELAKQVAGRNLKAQEWKQYFGRAPYRRTFDSLPDGAGVKETN